MALERYQRELFLIISHGSDFTRYLNNHESPLRFWHRFRDFNVRHPDTQNSLLEEACIHGRTDVAAFLLRNGVNPSEEIIERLIADLVRNNRPSRDNMIRVLMGRDEGVDIIDIVQRVGQIHDHNGPAIPATATLVGQPDGNNEPGAQIAHAEVIELGKDDGLSLRDIQVALPVDDIDLGGVKEVPAVPIVIPPATKSGGSPQPESQRRDAGGRRPGGQPPSHRQR